jgi:hypothetical protein
MWTVARIASLFTQEGSSINASHLGRLIIVLCMGDLHFSICCAVVPGSLGMIVPGHEGTLPQCGPLSVPSIGIKKSKSFTQIQDDEMCDEGVL